jgi:predicted GTPase
MAQTDSWLQLQTSMLEHGDAEGAHKVAELEEKLKAGKSAIAFSGHFSAGKSSLINQLCGRNLLPTGPIPTSANLVVIENGQEEAIVYAGDGAEEEGSSLSVPIDMLADYCKNGETYRRIDIRYPSTLLSDALSLMDTPGVDSTDDAHMLATESSLHLADAVLYVTDYNHVLSELNLSFTKRLNDWGKPLYIIVNQVDKHQDAELSYEDYKSNVKASFEAWGVHPEGFLFVSVKERCHPYSEWNKLIWLIEELKNQSRALLAHSSIRSAKVLIEAHVEAVYPSVLNVAAEDDANSSNQALAQGSDTRAELEEEEREVKRLSDEIAAWEDQPERMRSQFRAELTQVVDNAQIMPATIRDLAQRYLDSRKPGFKLGILFTEAKTKAEVASRLEGFYAPLLDAVEKQLIWHVHQLIRQYAEASGESTAQWQAIETNLTQALLTEEVKESAAFTNEYTMTYCRLITERIKSDCRRKAIESFEVVASAIQQSANKKAALAKARLIELSTSLQSKREQEQLVLQSEAYRMQLLALVEETRGDHQTSWPDPEKSPSVHLSLAANRQEGQPRGHEDEGETHSEPRAVSIRPAIADDLRASTDREGHKALTSPETSFHFSDVMAQTAEALERTAELLQPLHAFEQTRSALRNRADKLRNNRFTVALFGAFSAGKSSFANALIGESVLPVSPNPTTAAINSILPSTERYKHQTAQIHMKDHETLLSDIRYSLSMLGINADSIASVSQAATFMKQLSSAEVPAKGKPHLSFLRAVEKGYEAVSKKLGTVWTADFDTYRSYVAEEDKSCFVDAIDLHYDTAFGKQGVVFVDTPGADSIHARHTGVTFNYIKNADAILFVTYFNHAFSQADKQFLLQLGRVKDSFDLDKMFFLINAADLADSAEETVQVMEYVENQLLTHGIRQPRLFAVSSRNALEAKLSHSSERATASGITRFEQAFASFARGELAHTAIQSARAEITRVAGRLEQFIDVLGQGEAQREQIAMQTRDTVQRLSESLQNHVDDYAAQPVIKELEELLHHVKQRCYYRFGDLYNDAFHPSALQEDGRNMTMALQAAWKQLQQTSAIDASQELLATTLRMEQFIRQRTKQWNDYAIDAIGQELPGFIVDDWLEHAFPTPRIEESLGDLSTDEKLIRRLFKNAKSFFEGEGKSALKRVLETDVSDAISAYVDRHLSRLSVDYEALMNESIHRSLTQLILQMNEYAKQVSQVKEENQDIGDLQDRLSRIQEDMQRFA